MLWQNGIMGRPKAKLTVLIPPKCKKVSCVRNC